MANTLLPSVVTIAALFVYEVNGAAHIIKTTSDVEEWKVDSYAELAAKTGDTLIFNYNSNHDVFKMSDSTCGTTGNTELAKNDVGGGTAPLTNKYTYTVTAADQTAGTIYFACSTGSYGHCSGGQKITVTVTAADDDEQSSTTSLAGEDSTTGAGTPGAQGNSTTGSGATSQAMISTTGAGSTTTQGNSTAGAGQGQVSSCVASAVPLAAILSSAMLLL